MNQPLKAYKVLGIQRERIDREQAWQNYIESRFTVTRRLEDYGIAQARSWEEMLDAQRC